MATELPVPYNLVRMPKQLAQKVPVLAKLPGRVAMLSILAAPAFGHAQVLTGVGNSGVSSSVADSLAYTPYVGSQVNVESYFGASGASLGSATSNAHAYSNLSVDGAGGLTSAIEASFASASLDDGVNSAQYSSSLSAAASMSTSVTSTGADRDVAALSTGRADVSLSFTLSAPTLVSISGAAMLDGGSLTSVDLELDNLTTNSNSQIASAGGQFSYNALLGPGSYDLLGTLGAGAGFDYNPYQGALLKALGSFNESLGYTADFAQPTPTPGSGSVILGLIMVTGAFRLRRRS